MFTGCVCVQQQAMCGNSPGLVWIMHCIQVARAYSSQPSAAILPVWFGSCSVYMLRVRTAGSHVLHSPGLVWIMFCKGFCMRTAASHVLHSPGLVWIMFYKGFCMRTAARHVLHSLGLVWIMFCKCFCMRTAASHVRHSPGLVWITPPSLTPAFSSPTAAE